MAMLNNQMVYIYIYTELNLLPLNTKPARSRGQLRTPQYGHAVWRINPRSQIDGPFSPFLSFLFLSSSGKRRCVLVLRFLYSFLPDFPVLFPL